MPFCIRTKQLSVLIHPSSQDISALAPDTIGKRDHRTYANHAPVNEILRIIPDMTVRVLDQLRHHPDRTPQGIIGPMQRTEKRTGLCSRRIRPWFKHQLFCADLDPHGLSWGDIDA